MTRNQILYHQNRETERTNRVKEEEQHRTNVVQEQERERAARAQEAIQNKEASTRRLQAILSPITSLIGAAGSMATGGISNIGKTAAARITAAAHAPAKKKPDFVDWFMANKDNLPDYN